MAIEILPLLSPALEAAYLARVVKHDGCWGWTGAKYRGGYGKVAFAAGRHLCAHRLSFAMHRLQEPGDMQVCHSCDNPECSNPAHLWLGTAKLNSDDKIRKGRANHVGLAGAANPSARLSLEAVRQIRVELARGATCVRLGSQYGVHFSTISAIKTGATW